jgi:hypothetical protein
MKNVKCKMYQHAAVRNVEGLSGLSLSIINIQTIYLFRERHKKKPAMSPA